MKMKKFCLGVTALAATLAFMTMAAMPAMASDESTSKSNVGTAQTVQATAQAERIGTVTTQGSRLNLREGSGMNYKIIGKLDNGTTVTVLGEENGWYKVSVNGQTGYVSGKYLTVTESPAAAETTTEPPATPTPAPTPVPSPAPLTPDGNLSLLDDVTQSSDGKQFLTVQSKNDNTFYLIIDRDKDDENVYFLNKVDEADLMALTRDGEITAAVCTCIIRCEAGHIDMTCEVCRTSMVDCTGTVLEKPVVTPEPTAIPEPEEESDTSRSSPILMVLAVVVLGAGGAIYYLKFRKAKPDAKGAVDLDDFDFADDDEDDTEYVSEDEHSEDSKDSDKA